MIWPPVDESVSDSILNTRSTYKRVITTPKFVSNDLLLTWLKVFKKTVDVVYMSTSMRIHTTQVLIFIAIGSPTSGEKKTRGWKVLRYLTYSTCRKAPSHDLHSWVSECAFTGTGSLIGTMTRCLRIHESTTEKCSTIASSSWVIFGNAELFSVS